MCSHNGKELLLCEQCAGEQDYAKWKRETPDRPCPHDLPKSSCDICK